MTNEYDISIIGAGPGGYVAAIRAAQLGAKVCIIEKENNLGGTCLNWGCIPTKSLLHSAHSWQDIKSKDITAESIANISVDMKKIVKKSRQDVQKLTHGVKSLLSHNGIKIYTGRAYISSPGEINVAEHIIKTKYTIIATGAVSRQHPNLDVNGINILHAKHAMMLDNIPKKIAIVGGGPIGIEFASLFNSLGSEVYIVELSDSILSSADDDVINYMQTKLSSKGIKIITNTSVIGHDMVDNSVNLKFNTNKSIKVDKCLVAIGITGNIHDLGLQNTKIQINKNMQIITDEFSHTHERDIYAIGDVNHMGPWLAHRASAEGIKCVERILGHDIPPINLSQITGCVYSMPQIASFGLTEKKAISQGKKFRIGKFSLQHNGKAIATNDDGFIKLVIDRDMGNILGAHIVSNNATELISSIGMMHSLEGVCSEDNDYIFSHPTISEIIPEAILAAYGKAIHSVL